MMAQAGNTGVLMALKETLHLEGTGTGGVIGIS